MIKQADFITLHVPAQKSAIIGKEEIAKMKDGVALINCARGGVIDEEALIEALDAGKVSFAGLDVFVNEPTPSEKILTHPKINTSYWSVYFRSPRQIGENIGDAGCKYFKIS